MEAPACQTPPAAYAQRGAGTGRRSPCAVAQFALRSPVAGSSPRTLRKAVVPKADRSAAPPCDLRSSARGHRGTAARTETRTASMPGSDEPLRRSRLHRRSGLPACREKPEVSNRRARSSPGHAGTAEMGVLHEAFLAHMSGKRCADRRRWHGPSPDQIWNPKFGERIEIDLCRPGGHGND